MLWLLRITPLSLKRLLLKVELVQRIRDVYYGFIGSRIVPIPGQPYVMEIDFRRSEERIFLGGRYEKGLVSFFRRRIGEGAIVFDVGAYIGYYTLLFSYLIGPKGKVIAFEPFSAHCERLLRNLKLNNITNVTVEQCALADKIGCEILYIPNASIKASLVRQDGIKQEIIRTLTLDEYTTVNKLVPDMVKIDVEGAEERLIHGAQELLKNHNPLLVIEFNNEFDHDRVTDMLIKLGYKRSVKIAEESYGFWMAFEK